VLCRKPTCEERPSRKAQGLLVSYLALSETFQCAALAPFPAWFSDITSKHAMKCCEAEFFGLLCSILQKYSFALKDEARR
jgi:hypothetical protein